MGAFLNSLHLRTADADAVAGALAARADPESALRDLVLVQRDGWVSVFDDPLYGLSDLAAQLSGVLDVAVLRVAVSDSSSALLALYERGEARAVLSQPEAKRKRKRKPQAAREAFGPVLAAGATVAQLAAVWADDPLSKEDLIAASAPLFGLAVDLACGDLEDYAEDGRALRVAVGRAPAPRAGPDGPVRLEHRGGSLEIVDGVEGQEFTIHLTASNAGAQGLGLELEITGPALQDGLARVERVLLAFGLGERRPLAEIRRERGVFVARAEDAKLAVRPAPRSIVDLFMDDAEANLRVEGVFEGAGAAALQLRVTPCENPAGGYARSFELRPIALKYRPLLLSSPEGLFQLNHEHNLVAWVALEDRAGTEVRHGLEAMVRLHGALRIAADQPYRIVTCVADKSPRTAELEAAELSLTALTKRIRGKSSLALERVLGERDLQTRDTDGMALQLADHTRDADKASPAYLGLWVAVQPRTAGELAELDDVMGSMIDELCRTGLVRQAFMTRWGAKPDHFDFDLTPYESACGGRSECVARTFWVERYLRSVAPRLWLGPKLKSHLSRTRLPDRARVNAIGSCTRIDCDIAALPALEQALRPLLADAAAYERGSRRAYGS